MTNRERFMQELAALPNAALYDALLDINAVTQFTDRLCYRCEADNGGECPVGDDGCLLDSGELLSEEWSGENLLNDNRRRDT